MTNRSGRITIEKISIGFSGIVNNKNYRDCHRSMRPFGLKWGRGLIIKEDNYIYAVTGSYGITHSWLKEKLTKYEKTIGTFYYGYNLENKTLYLEYASDNNFEFRDKEILNAIMDAIKEDNGPLKNFKINN